MAQINWNSLDIIINKNKNLNNYSISFFNIKLIVLKILMCHQKTIKGVFCPINLLFLVNNTINKSQNCKHG